MLSPKTITQVALLVGSIAAATPASEPPEQALERRFAVAVHPFLETYCFTCHGDGKQEGKLKLSTYTSTAAVVMHLRLWEIVVERLEAEEMPPEEAKRQPSPEERRAVIQWVEALRAREAQRNAGDPGPVLARRLSNAEYDYTIRDLTGVDIRPTRQFPIDPANEAGFDNSGESLAMSPALLNKYLSAARHVADHIVLKPTGFVFAPHPAVTDTDRDKYCVRRIVDFYERQRTDYADYFTAAWRYHHRDVLGKPAATLAHFAAEEGLSAKYLATIWETLVQSRYRSGPLATLQVMWRGLPAPDDNQSEAARRGCEQMRDYAVGRRKQLTAEVGSARVEGISRGSQAFVLWKNRRLAANRMRYTAGGNTPAGDRQKTDLEWFCEIFPDTFFVSERGRMFLDAKDRNKGRLLSAGFHLMVGYFRDDRPLYELMLDEDARRQLDSLWRELNFVAFVPMRQYKDYVFFERAEPPWFMKEAEFDFARSEDKDVISQTKIERLSVLYLAKARNNGGRARGIKAVEDHFATISTDIRWVEKARLAAQPSHVEALARFAERAYRRPLSGADRDELLAFYRSLREQEKLSHEDAVRDVVVSVLMSPYFWYRVDLPPAGEAARPVSDYALASRLSYFLWSSMPDEPLLAHAAAGDLHRRGVLVAQMRRMLADGRVRGLATEFGGNWLDFRHFEQHNSVDRERFKSFTDPLRQAMYEEPIRFVVDLMRRDGSVLDLLYAEHTFVNPLLADHYGMPVRKVGPDEWVRVDEAHRYGRGGLLPMSVFLTANAPGLRTSPVMRGYWVVRRLLGEHIPPPPPKVPELPKDEAKLGDVTLREILAQHRQSKSCAGCHERFDSIGLVFEGYGPIGERRAKDLGGRPVDDRATFPGGSEGAGLDGLRRYLREHRQEEFVDNLCRKLLAYALGRSLLLSDESTLAAMRAKLAADDYRVAGLVETIVTSPQFLNKRGRDQQASR